MGGGSGRRRKYPILIIIGLFDDLSEAEKKTLNDFSKSQEDLTVQTWDFILRNIDIVRQEMMDKLRDSQ